MGGWMETIARSGVLRRITGVLVAVPLVSGWAVTGTRVDTKYYPISGRNFAELVSSVRQHGPMGAYGMGIIDFHPRFETRVEDGKCSVFSAETGLAVSLKLPEWRGPRDAPRSVERVARHFERAIRAHELQHVEIARRYQRLITSALKKMKPEANCWTCDRRRAS